MHLRSRAPEDTQKAGRCLGESLEAGLVIALLGPLGAGKTLFAKGLAEGLGVDPTAVASPTFTIASEYTGRDGRPFAHVDCYRLANAAELEGAGFLDLLRPEAVVAVEWGDRVPGALPADRLEIRIERASSPAAGSASEEASHRTLNAIASGPGAEAVLARWREALGA